VRLGTPALTTRGLDEQDFDRVAALVDTVLKATKPALTSSNAASKAQYVIDAGVAEKVRAECDELLAAHPLYPGLVV
jgi:glycine hydroxymethyltransferase